MVDQGGNVGDQPASRGRPAEVVVVGVVVVGCSLADRLAAAGRRVLLLERRGLAAGASGRNGGKTGTGSTIHAGSPAGRAVVALTRANLRLLQAVPAELGADVELRLPGTLDLITTPEQHTHLAAAVADQRAAGLDLRRLDRQEARALLPALSPAVLGAAYPPDRGHLWPFALVAAFAAAARRHGAEIRTGVEVERRLRTGERVVGVVAGGAAIAAGDVVLATNAYTRALLPALPAGAIVPARGQMLVTQPLPPVRPLPFGTNVDKAYGRRPPSGQILCSGFRRRDVGEGLGTSGERVTPAVLVDTAACLCDRFPALREGSVRVVRAWVGIMGFTADGLPLLGRYAPAPGLTLAAGFNGGGFSWAAVVGRVVADLLTGLDPGFDLATFRPDRFAAGVTAWRNPFTTGERSRSEELAQRAEG